MAIRTIFSMAEDCARGERLGWQEFVRDFAGIARCLLAHYFPTLVPELDQHVVAVFRRAGSHSGAWFAGLSFANEREFMMAFRDLVFAYGREQERLAPQRANTGRAGDPVVPMPPLSLDQLRSIMEDLPLLERELLWLFIKGYDAQRIAAMMMNAAATAEAVQRIADERLAEFAAGSAPDALAVSLRVLMELAEQSNTDQCASLKTFNNLVNGQIAWRERELAEEHMSNCFYCIDRFTTFQEMVRLRKDVAGLAAPEVEAMLARLPLAAAKPRGMLSRLFAGR
jgi:hypothetical protein